MPVQCYRKNCKYHTDHIFYGNLCTRKNDRGEINLIVVNDSGKCTSYERKPKLR